MKCVIYEFRLVLICLLLLVLIVKLTVTHLRLLKITHLWLFQKSYILTMTYIMDGSYWLAVILNREVRMGMLISNCLELIILERLLLELRLVVLSWYLGNLSIKNSSLFLFWLYCARMYWGEVTWWIWYLIHL